MSDQDYYRIRGIDTGWIFKTNDGVVGPIDTEQFLLAIRNGTVVPQTLVRLATSQQWMTAAEIAGLEFPANLPTVPDGNPTKPASVPHLPSNIEMQRLFVECLDSKKSKSPVAERVRPPSTVSDLNFQFRSAIGFVVSYVSETVSLIGQSALSFLARGLILRGILATMVVVLAVLVITPLLPRVGDAIVSKRQIQASLTEIFTEVKELRSMDTDSNTWKGFRERSEKKLGRLLPRLMRTANISDPASMSQLWIAQDYLPILLVAPKTDSIKTDEKIATLLKIAEAAIQKGTPQGEPWDIVTALVVGVDILGACAALAFFGRSWLSRAFAMR